MVYIVRAGWEYEESDIMFVASTKENAIKWCRNERNRLKAYDSVSIRPMCVDATGKGTTLYSRRNSDGYFVFDESA